MHNLSLFRKFPSSWPRPSHSEPGACWNAMPTTAWQGLFLQSPAFPPLHMDVQVREAQGKDCS